MSGCRPSASCHFCRLPKIYSPCAEGSADARIARSAKQMLTGQFSPEVWSLPFRACECDKYVRRGPAVLTHLDSVADRMKEGWPGSASVGAIDSAFSGGRAGRRTKSLRPVASAVSRFTSGGEQRRSSSHGRRSEAGLPGQATVLLRFTSLHMAKRPARGSAGSLLRPA